MIKCHKPILCKFYYNWAHLSYGETESHVRSRYVPGQIKVCDKNALNFICSRQRDGFNELTTDHLIQVLNYRDTEVR